MATEFNIGSFFARWLFAIALVLGTYNPSDYSYVSWVMGESSVFGPIMAFVGVLLLILPSFIKSNKNLKIFFTNLSIWFAVLLVLFSFYYVFKLLF